MNILHINTYAAGGAAIACLRLHKALLQQNVRSRVLLRYSDESAYLPEQCFVFPTPNRSITNRITSRLKRILKYSYPYQEKLAQLKQFRQGLEIITYPFSPCDITQSPLYQQADIIHLHWVADFLDWYTFFKKNQKPLIWTLHDQNPFLGIEHYQERYGGIDNSGNIVARQISHIELKEEEKMLAFKSKAILQNKKPIYVVAPSRWMLQQSQKSQILGKYPHFHIPYAQPNHIFRPLEKSSCRQLLGIPTDKKVILFVSHWLPSLRKGFFLLESVIETIADDSIVFVTIGQSPKNFSCKQTIHLGEIKDERLMCAAYSAADLFVSPSLMDNLPNTIAESLLCGTPVVAFPVGGIQEMIQDYKNGFLCPEVSLSSLYDTILKAITHLSSFQRYVISQQAADEYNPSRRAREYIALYEQLLNEAALQKPSS